MRSSGKRLQAGNAERCHVPYVHGEHVAVYSIYAINMHDGKSMLRVQCCGANENCCNLVEAFNREIGQGVYDVSSDPLTFCQ